MHLLLNAHLSMDRHSLLVALLLLVAHLFPDRHCRHPHLLLCTRPFMDTLLIVPLLWLTHFIQTTLAWAVSLHESKLFWLTHFFRAALVWYSTLVYQILSFVTDALLHLLFLPFSLPVLYGAYAHPPLFMLYASCMPSATSSTFHLYRVSWAALHPHCPTSQSCHAFTAFTSAIQLFLFPEASLCPHLFTLCAPHMPSVACSAIHLLFVFLSISTPFSLHNPCDASLCLMPHQLPFIFFPLLGHPSTPIFSHSMHFL